MEISVDKKVCSVGLIVCYFQRLSHFYQLQRLSQEA